MKISGLSELLQMSRRILRATVGQWNLERKSLLFLGVALVIPMGMGFWFVLKVVAEDLVVRTTQQSARDYARAVIAWRHVDKRKVMGAPVLPNEGVSYFLPEVLTILREQLVDNPSYRHEFLMLDDTVQHQDLPNSELPDTDRERKLLTDLESEFRRRVQSNLERFKGTTTAATAPTQSGTPSVASESENLLAEPLFRDDGPVFPEGKQDTPPEGWYVYYHVIEFPENCLVCHQRHMRASVDDVPFRVVKVMIPNRHTEVASATTLAVMIAVAMVTIAATLLVVHWVFRKLVLQPLQHLKHVSDEISRGDISSRANIDTGDEFNELGDAFNRMLRHMTNDRQQLEALNHELDIRIDQLAQANLKLYEANRLKSDFLANMSHELRTPLNSIIGFSDVLSDIDALTEKQRRYAQNIQKSGKLLLDMINDILDLAKIEAGKLNVTPSSFDLTSLVSAQCDMLHSLIDEKNMDLHTQFPMEMDPVFQDQPKIQQILTNLLSNAIKFTPDGGSVTVSVGMVTPAQFHLTVTDTGVGIAESEFEVIFEKFRQSSAIVQEDGLTRAYSGTGLGLSIVKELCKLLGGEVRLSSQLGHGSTFRVILPMHYYESSVELSTL